MIELGCTVTGVWRAADLDVLRTCFAPHVIASSQGTDNHRLLVVFFFINEGGLLTSGRECKRLLGRTKGK